MEFSLLLSSRSNSAICVRMLGARTECTVVMVHCLLWGVACSSSSSSSSIIIIMSVGYLAPPFFFLLPGRPLRVLDSMMSWDCFLRPCRVTTSSSSPLASSSTTPHTITRTLDKYLRPICNLYISRLCYDVSVRLSVTEVHLVTVHAVNTAAAPASEVEAIIRSPTNMAAADVVAV